MYCSEFCEIFLRTTLNQICLYCLYKDLMKMDEDSTACTIRMEGAFIVNSFTFFVHSYYYF